jgi:hypothetical protein
LELWTFTRVKEFKLATRSMLQNKPKSNVYFYLIAVICYHLLCFGYYFSIIVLKQREMKHIT